MTRYRVGAVVAVLGGYYIAHLETVPHTGRRRFIDITPKQEQALAELAYQDIIKKFRNKILAPQHPVLFSLS